MAMANAKAKSKNAINGMDVIKEKNFFILLKLSRKSEVAYLPAGREVRILKSKVFTILVYSKLNME
jgi:hypothetical protein